MKNIFSAVVTLSLVTLGLSACTSKGGSGVSNSAPDRTVSQPRRGSY